MAALESLLQQAGFTDYEARAYLALCHKSPQTGYEVAKTSRIPRANIYEVLKKLEARGAATRVVHPQVVRYSAVHPETLLQRMKDDFSSMMMEIEGQLDSFVFPQETSHVEQFDGYLNLVGFGKDLLARVENELLLATHPEESIGFRQELEQLNRTKAEVGVLCLHGCSVKCGACQGNFHRDPFARPHHPRLFIAVADRKDLIAAEIDGNDVTGIRTGLRFLVNMAASLVEQSILMSGLFDRMESLDPAFLHKSAAREAWFKDLVKGDSRMFRSLTGRSLSPSETPQPD